MARGQPSITALAARSAKRCTGTLVRMNPLITLFAAVAGAFIALAGQYMTRRGEARVRTAEFLLEQCATIIALSGYWRRGQADSAELERRREEDKEV